MEEKSWIAELGQFYGTQNYYRFSGLFRNSVLTDGTNFLAQKAGCYWLFEAIESHLSYIPETEWFICSTLNVNLKTAKANLIIDDGNGRTLRTQEIEYTDFPLEKFSTWAVRGDQFSWVHMLPTEY